MTETGLVAYDTRRACDNCDKPIQERCWFACPAEGCDVDFCTKCYRALGKLFEGRDTDHMVWVGKFLSGVAEFTLTSTSAAQRRAFVQHLAFDWPLHMFDLLIRAVVDVVDAMVVHVQDGENKAIDKDVDFWHMVGFMQLCLAANNLPAHQLRFGELAQREPRIPGDRFVLRAINKCDADAEWQRWRQKRLEQHCKDHAQSDVLNSEPFQVTCSFAFFLAHGDFVPIGFRQRCLMNDVNDAAFGRRRRRGRRGIPELRMEVPRELGALRQVIIAKMGKKDANVAARLQVSFEGEPGEGPGVLWEFLSLAAQSLLHGDRSGGGGASGSSATGAGPDAEGAGAATVGDTSASSSPRPDAGAGARTSTAAPSAGSAAGWRSGWSYDPQLRTYWFAEPMQARPEAYRALGALLGHSVLMGAWLPVAFPRALYALLLRELGSSQVPPFTVSDVASVAPSLASGLQELVEYDAPDVAEMFSLDWPRALELEAAAGAGQAQTARRAAYVDAYVQWFFSERFAPQFAPLAAGFCEVLGRSRMLQTLVDATQLEQIICGAEEPLDVDAVRSSAEESGWGARDAAYLSGFWEVLRGFSSAEQRSFVVFVSACRRMPPQGWRDLNLRVQRNGEGDERLPAAHTCFNLLLLPRYSSAEVLRARLRAAITETEGFGLS